MIFATSLLSCHFVEPWQLALAILGALLVGVAKTGVAGMGILVTALFANLLPAREASGFVLPMLIFGDFLAVAAYRQHADWRLILRLFPWTIPGILLGTFTLGRVDDRSARLMIGIIIAVLVVWQWIRKLRGTGTGEEQGYSIWRAALLGTAAGFTTLVANAAGPIMILYLLAAGLPKMAFVGTTAVFFCALNLFKVPFMVHLDLINLQSLSWNLVLAPAVFVGAWFGRWVLKVIPQRRFEQLALGLSALAAIKLMF
jgi:uncharacterized membrane protein YfcA